MILATAIWRIIAPLMSGSAAFVIVLVLGASASAHSVGEVSQAAAPQDCSVIRCDAPNTRPMPPAQWSAVAVSNSRALVGISHGLPSRQDASGVALTGCRGAANHVRDCRIVGSFNSGCAALATSQEDLAWGFSGTSNDLQRASDVALSMCQRYGGNACVIVARFCST